MLGIEPALLLHIRVLRSILCTLFSWNTLILGLLNSVTMGMQGTIYLPSPNLFKCTLWDFWFSLLCCFSYMFTLICIIQLIHSTGTILTSTRDSSLPLQCATTSNTWGSLPDNHLPYYKVLHLCHFGDAFDQLCQLNPDFIHLLGVTNNFDLHPNTSQSPMCQQFAFTLDDLLYPSIDLTTITSSYPSNSTFVRFQSAYTMSTGEYPLIFDSGTSITITPHYEDFVSFTKNIGPTTLHGVSAATVCQGKGTVRYTVYNDDGVACNIETTALYVPNARVCLLSVQSYC